MLGVTSLAEAKEIIKYKLSPMHELQDHEFNIIINLCETHNINPAHGMLYLRRNEHNHIFPTLTIDGWFKLVNDKDDCNGYIFHESDVLVDIPQSGGVSTKAFEYIGCQIFRKGRDHAPVVKEYVLECINQFNAAWYSHTNRLLRHAAFIQCARMTYNLSGIYNETEELSSELSLSIVKEVTDESFEVLNTSDDSLEVFDDDITAHVDELNASDETLVKHNGNVIFDDIAEPSIDSKAVDVNTSEVNPEVIIPEDIVKQRIDSYLISSIAKGTLESCVIYLKSVTDEQDHGYIERESKDLVA